MKDTGKGNGRSKRRIVIVVAVALVLAALYYYVALPPINIHAPGFWKFIIVLALIITAVYGISHINRPAEAVLSGIAGVKRAGFKDRNSSRIFKILAGISVGLIVVFLVGQLMSSVIFNADAYQQLLTIETRDFAEDIKEVSYNEIPLLDKDSAQIIGTRVMGTMVDMVSQFEVADYYTQINYQNKPYRVTPLRYGSIIKWIANNKNGIPAYIKIDMTNQKAECVRLEKGIKYSTSDHFDRNIYRHLRFHYPTYIFDDISFEIDDEGTPYWVCPVKKYNIGLFGGVTIGRVVLCNAITGACRDYQIDEVPDWIDRVYSAELLIQLYDYNGLLKNGFFNSILSQKGCLQTTDGYNYIALDDDVWVYTGITSVGQDNSNVGFVLMNQRTAETRYYEVAGAEEYSAMSSAEGKVQHLGYKATFPLVLNIEGQPTYFMALKDSAGLVKQYAMLNIEKYQTVATGDTVAACEKEYIQILTDNGIIDGSAVQEESNIKTVKGTVTKIAQLVVDGNSHFYVQLDGGDEIYDINFADVPLILTVEEGDEVTLTYTKGEHFLTVSGLIK